MNPVAWRVARTRVCVCVCAYVCVYLCECVRASVRVCGRGLLEPLAPSN